MVSWFEVPLRASRRTKRGATRDDRVDAWRAGSKNSFEPAATPRDGGLTTKGARFDDKVQVWRAGSKYRFEPAAAPKGFRGLEGVPAF